MGYCLSKTSEGEKWYWLGMLAFLVGFAGMMALCYGLANGVWHGNAGRGVVGALFCTMCIGIGSIAPVSYFAVKTLRSINEKKQIKEAIQEEEHDKCMRGLYGAGYGVSSWEA